MKTHLMLPAVLFSLLLPFLASAQVTSHAATLAGVYELPADCSFRNAFLGEVRLPAGLVVIAENAPVFDHGMGEQPALLVEGSLDLHPLLVLRLGQGAPFSFGPNASVSGAYDTNGRGFSVQYSTPIDSGREVSSLHLVKAENGVRIDATSPQGTTSCFLNGK